MIFVGFFLLRIFYDSKNVYILLSFCFHIFAFLSSATKSKVFVTVLVSSVFKVNAAVPGRQSI